MMKTQECKKFQKYLFSQRKKFVNLYLYYIIIDELNRACLKY